jgi:hypothetical protein
MHAPSPVPGMPPCWPPQVFNTVSRTPARVVTRPWDGKTGAKAAAAIATAAGGTVVDACPAVLCTGGSSGVQDIVRVLATVNNRGRKALKKVRLLVGE